MAMKTVLTTLREDFGRLDRNLIRREILAEAGVRSVTEGPGEHCLSIEYDPVLLDHDNLVAVMCRLGLYPQAANPPSDEERRPGA